MASISSQLVLHDGMTSTLRSINKALNLVLSSFESVQRASGQAVDTASIITAREELGKANANLEQMEQAFKDCDTQQKNLNRNIDAGTVSTGKLLGKVKSLAAAWLGMKGVTWLKESLELFDTQHNAEVQLSVSLKNMGAAESALDTLKKKASEIQGISMYGDEAMLGGAAEFATYMTDENAIAKMMDTLSNYAAGMSGGGEVGYKEMVDYATQLGKVLNGTFDGIAKKGFVVTDAQKEIIENGTDMEKALVVDEIISESWAGLSEQMANTPTGQILQMKNAWGDMREELAAGVYPAVMLLFSTISGNSETISSIIVGLKTPINALIVCITRVLQAAIGVYNFFANNWTAIKPIVYSLVAIMAAYNAVLLIHKGIQVAQLLLTKLQTIQKYKEAKAVMAQVAAIDAEAAATLTKAAAEGADAAALTAQATALGLVTAGMSAETVATSAATVAQTGFNTALWACPLTWIIALVIVLIVLVAVFFEQVVGAIWWLGALFKNVGLWIANCGIAAWEVIKNIGLWFANLGLSIWTVIKNIGLWFANLGLSVWAIIKNTGLWFANLGMGIWNVLKAACSNVGTAFHNAWIGIQVGFWSMLDAIMQGLKSLAEKANKCLGWMGVNIDTSGLDFASKKIDELNSKKESYESISDAWAEGFSTFQYDSVSEAYNTYDYGSVTDAWNTNDIDWSKVTDGFNTFDTFQDGWGSEAYSAGAEIGKNIKDSIGNALSLDNLTKQFDIEDTDDYSGVLDDIGDDTSSIAGSAKNTTEDLAYLRDIAEMEAINRFTTAEVKIDMTGMTNKIDSSMDLDGVITVLTEGFAEALETAAEGVHS